MKRPYTNVIKDRTSQAKLPCPPGEGTPFTYTNLEVCASCG